MNTVLITWQERIEVMEEIAGTTGSTCFEQVAEEASEMFNLLHRKVGKNFYNVNIEYEEIPQNELNKLIEFIESE